MYCTKLDIPVIPEDLKKEIIDFVIVALEEGYTSAYNRQLEVEDQGNLNFLDGEDENLLNTGEVIGVPLSEELQTKIRDFYKQTPHYIDEFFCDYWGCFVLKSSTSIVAPHQDDPEKRKFGLQLLIKAGGDNVKTTWYDIKEEFKNLPIIPDLSMPYHKLNPVHEEHLHEGHWYILNTSIVHSVDNLESVRIFLSGGKEGNTDSYDEVVKLFNT